MSWPFELKGKRRPSIGLRKEGFHVSEGDENIGRHAAHARVISPPAVVAVGTFFLCSRQTFNFSISKICK